MPPTPPLPSCWHEGLRSQLFFDLAPDQLREGVPLRRAQVRRRRMHVQVTRVVHELLLQQLQARRGVRLQRLNRRGIGRVQRRTVMVEPLVVKLASKSVRSWSRLQLGWWVFGKVGRASYT